MNKRRNLMISVISAIISCLLVYGIYSLQLKQVEFQKTVYVVAPKQFIDAGIMITADMLEYKPIIAASYDQRMFLEEAKVTGYETGIALGRGEPILDWKLNKFNLLPNHEQSTFQIPKEYILSISNGIRAGDKVRIYISGPHESSRKLFSEEIVVASVKSAANLEVEDVNNSSILSRANEDLEQLYASRRNANAAIDQINLNLTEEQWLTIDRICKTNQTKLVIAFTSSFSNEDGWEQTGGGEEPQ